MDKSISVLWSCDSLSDLFPYHTHANSTLFLGNIILSSLTIDLDLNGPSPQFTLTCISTGGPATTVTWTRDSVTVTEGTESVLNDPVTAQYTHTLTGRLGGLYTCTVANDKPSSASAELLVEGIITPGVFFTYFKC